MKPRRKASQPSASHVQPSCILGYMAFGLQVLGRAPGSGLDLSPHASIVQGNLTPLPVSCFESTRSGKQDLGTMASGTKCYCRRPEC